MPTGNNDLGGDSSPGCWPSHAADESATTTERTWNKDDGAFSGPASCSRATLRHTPESRMMMMNLPESRCLMRCGCSGCLKHGAEHRELPSPAIVDCLGHHQHQFMTPSGVVGSAVDLLKSTPYVGRPRGQWSVNDHSDACIQPGGCASCATRQDITPVSFSSLPRRRTDFARVPDKALTTRKNINTATASVSTVGK